MAPATAVHLNSTGDATPVALFAGETSVVGVLLHGAPLATVMVKARDTPEGQSPNRASTTQLMVPLGTAAVSCVAVTVAPIKKRSPAVEVVVSTIEPNTR